MLAVIRCSDCEKPRTTHRRDVGAWMTGAQTSPADLITPVNVVQKAWRSEIVIRQLLLQYLESSAMRLGHILRDGRSWSAHLVWQNTRLPQRTRMDASFTMGQNLPGSQSTKARWAIWSPIFKSSVQHRDGCFDKWKPISGGVWFALSACRTERSSGAYWFRWDRLICSASSHTQKFLR